MKLYHLDWELARGISEQTLWALITPEGIDEKALSEGNVVYDSAALAFNGDCYKLVAEIDGSDLNFAYRQTQNIDFAWFEQPEPGVSPISEGPFRSTSIGDLIETNGTFMIVATVGFKELIGFGELTKRAEVSPNIVS